MLGGAILSVPFPLDSRQSDMFQFRKLPNYQVKSSQRISDICTISDLYYYDLGISDVIFIPCLNVRLLDREMKTFAFRDISFQTNN